MPVSYARRKLANVLPPEAVPPDVVPPDPDVLVLLPLLPHADAISARPTAREAAVRSHFRVCLRFKVVTSRARFLSRRRSRRAGLPARGAFLLTAEGGSELEATLIAASEPERPAAPRRELGRLRPLDHAVDSCALGRVEDPAVAQPERNVIGEALGAVGDEVAAPGGALL